MQTVLAAQQVPRELNELGVTLSEGLVAATTHLMHVQCSTLLPPPRDLPPPDELFSGRLRGSEVTLSLVRIFDAESLRAGWNASVCSRTPESLARVQTCGITHARPPVCSSHYKTLAVSTSTRMVRLTELSEDTNLRVCSNDSPAPTHCASARVCRFLCTTSCVTRLGALSETARPCMFTP